MGCRTLPPLNFDPPLKGEVAAAAATDGGVSPCREEDTPPPRASRAVPLPLRWRIGWGLAFALTLFAAPAFAQEAQTPEQRLDALDQRITRLEDMNQVERVQRTYGYFVDKSQWVPLSELFTEDATLEIGGKGLFLGRDRVLEYMQTAFGKDGTKAGLLANHMQFQPIVTVADDGMSAKGRWQGMVMLAEPGQNGVWGIGVYENEYVKQRGVWKIASLHFYVTAETDYDAGWLKSAIPMEGPSALFPPDRPPSEVYRTFPSNYIPPFSFDHPVTGQSLKDLPQPADDVARPE